MQTGMDTAKRCICDSSVIFENGKVLLIRHRKLGIWLYPGGHASEGENPQETAVRETREETGLDVQVIGSNNLISGSEAEELPRPFTIMSERVKYSTEVHLHFDMVYLAVPESGSRYMLNTEEAEAMKWFRESEIGLLVLQW